MRLLFAALTVLGIVASTLFLTGQASAQRVCTSHEAATTQLEKQVNERVAGRGLANRGKAMIELFVSEKGSWTVVISDPKGRSCVLATGDNWQQVPLLVGDPA